MTKKINQLNFISIGDKNFFVFIKHCANNLLNIYPKSIFFIYNWGFTERQKEILKSLPNVVLIEWRKFLKNNLELKSINSQLQESKPNAESKKREYLLNQKPFCILDCAKRIDKNLIFIDGDAVIINPIEEIFDMEFDIGVTMKSRYDIMNAKKYSIRGEINSGVIYFKTDSNSIQGFVEKWIKELNLIKQINTGMKNREYNEQTALTLIVEKEDKNIYNNYYNKGVITINNKVLNVITLPCKVYNMYKLDKLYKKNVKVLHFKGRRSRSKIGGFIKIIKIRAFFDKFFKIFPETVKKAIKTDLYIDFVEYMLINPDRLESLLNIKGFTKKFEYSILKIVRTSINLIF